MWRNGCLSCCVFQNASAQNSGLFLCRWRPHIYNGINKGDNFVFSRYIPPLLWGKSGHLQTALYGKLGRVSSPNPSGVRMYLPMVDGATATFDLFEPTGNHQTGGDFSWCWSCILSMTLFACRIKDTDMMLNGRDLKTSVQMFKL